MVLVILALTQTTPCTVGVSTFHWTMWLNSVLIRSIWRSVRNADAIQSKCLMATQKVQEALVNFVLEVGS